MNCAISSTNLTNIKCTLGRKTASASAILTNSANPQNQYISGSGFFYQRWNITNLSEKSSQKLRQVLEAGDLSNITL